MPLISPTTRAPGSGSSHLRGQSCQQKGNSLLELMLSLGVMAAVTLSVITMNDKAQNKERGRLAADALQSFTQIAAQYFIANRVELENIMSGDLSHAANFCAINLSSASPNGVLAANALKRTCAIDTSLLKAKGLWPESLPINTGANRFVAVFRQLTIQNVANGADEVLVFSAPLDQGAIRTQGEAPFTASVGQFVEQTHASLASLGAMGGFIPPGKDYGACLYNDRIKQACGQGWKINLSDFL